MSNPTFSGGPIGFEVASAVEQFRLVKINDNGKVEHAGAEGAVFGAVTEARNVDDIRSADFVAVHYGDSAVKLQVSGGNAQAIKAGAPVFAAANGEVAAVGDVQVGVAARNGEGARVLTVLNGLPTAGV